MTIDKSIEFRDPIHGFIRVNENELKIINDPVFQRLRRVKQLSFGYLVYHGAEHSRFGHVLGAMHIVERALRKIEINGKKLGTEVKITEDDIQLARFAALLHDVGHKPFSHALDRSISEPHEKYSETLVQYHFDEILRKAKVDPKRVVDLINGKSDPDKPFLVSLISGQLDVDKFDYLLRDSYYAGVKYGLFDLDRLLDSLYVKDGGLVILDGGLYAAEQLIIARYHMFEQVYLHKTKRAFEGMAIILVNYLQSKNKFGYPTTKQLKNQSYVKDFIKYDDAWLLGKILEVNDTSFGHISKSIRDRTPYKSLIDSERLRRVMKLNKEGEQSEGYLNAVEDDLHANLSKLGIKENEIIFDKVGNLPYKLRPYSNPNGGEDDEKADTVFVYDNKTQSKEPIEDKSKLVMAVATRFNIRRIYVKRDRHDKLLGYLKEKYRHFR